MEGRIRDPVSHAAAFVNTYYPPQAVRVCRDERLAEVPAERIAGSA